MYLCEALSNILIQHLVKFERWSNKYKIPFSTFKARNQCFSTQWNNVKTLFKQCCLGLSHEFSSNPMLPHHLFRTSHGDSRGCRWLLLAHFYPYLNKMYPIWKLINSLFLPHNEYIAPYIFTHVFFIFYLLISPSGLLHLKWNWFLLE